MADALSLILFRFAALRFTRDVIIRRYLLMPRGELLRCRADIAAVREAMLMMPY